MDHFFFNSTAFGVAGTEDQIPAWLFSKLGTSYLTTKPQFLRLSNAGSLKLT